MTDNQSILDLSKNNNSLSPRSLTLTYNEDEVIYVITRTGKIELLDPNQITNRLKLLINRQPAIPHVNPYQLMLTVSSGLKSKMHTSDIDEYAANVAASASVTNPYYLKVAARIAIDNHQKNTIRSFVDKMRRAYLYKDKDGKITPLLSAEFFKYVECHQDEIEKMIDYSRDFLLDFFGFRTFQSNFSLKIDQKPIERPQDMFMRTAIALHMNTTGINNTNADSNPVADSKLNSTNSTEQELGHIKETYDLLSQKYYTHASPTYFNAGGIRQQFASCFLMGTGDSRRDILHTADNISKISKWAGGIGVHINEWRGTGARIRSTNGKSSGVVPFLRLIQTDLEAFNQGGRRPGSAAVYLMPHHPDIMKFIELPRNGGNEKDRARDLFTSMWLPDLFLERVAKRQMWSLFDPDQSEDLSKYWGKNYAKKYFELEAAKKYTQQLPARDIWRAMLETNKDVGHPYICFGDNANKYNMQSNLGILKSSNLCVEIYLYSDKNEHAVCVLSSIALPMYVLDGYSEEELKQPENERRVLNHEFPRNPYFDFKKFAGVVKTICTNLNVIVDKTFHPCKESARGNNRHRPIGIGVQGLADCYIKMRYPFASTEARQLNKQIFEALYYAAISQSTRLARETYLKLRKECQIKGSVTVSTYQPQDYKKHPVTYTNPDDIPKKIGAYSSIDWNGGSPYTRGQFHWDLYGLKEKDLSGMFDWQTVREHVLTFGVKNSLLVALMPTASTSQLLGNNESFEAYTSNIYKRSTLAGEHIVINKYLMNDLYSLGLWSSTIKDYLIATRGSIKYIEGIPNGLKQLYPTALEVGMKEIIQQAVDRQPFVDQGQSLNWHVDQLNEEEWTSYITQAWKGGLKTAKYYLHTRPAAMPQIFTLDPKKQEEMKALLEKNKHGTAFMESKKIECELCSS